MNIRGKRIKCVSNLHAPELVVGKVYTAGEVRTNTHGIWQVEVDGKWYAHNRFELAKENEGVKQQFYVGDVVEVVKTEPENWYKVGDKFVVSGWNDGKEASMRDLPHVTIEGEGKGVWVMARDLKILSRAWQKNTGKQPVEDDVEVEVKLRCAVEDKCLAGEFHWNFEDCTGDIVEWRLADSVYYVEEQPKDSVPPSQVAGGEDVPASVKVWCDTCEGTGEIDETIGGESFSGRDTPCPACDGKGWWEKIMPEISSADVAEQTDKKHSHYFKKCGYEYVDVYRVLKMFDVTDPCISHACKKLLVSGGRGFKDINHDIQDVIDTLVRWQEMRKEDDELCK